MHGLRGRAPVVDIRNLGLMAAIELAPAPRRARRPRLRGAGAAPSSAGLLVRTTGDTIALSPPLIIGEPEIADMAGMLGAVLVTIE